MERRKFLIGAGSAAVGSSALIGSGAFSNVQANRSVSLQVVGDEEAYLGLSGTSQYAESPENGVLSLDFGTETSDGRSGGLNQDATTSFGELFEITNGGDRTVAVWFDDGRADIDAGDQYWSEGNFNQKVDELVDGGHPEDYYNFYAEEGDEDDFSGGLNSFPVVDVAPTQIDTAEFDNPDGNGVILDAGDSVSVGAYFGDTADFSVGEINDAKITIWAYSQKYAENQQED